MRALALGLALAALLPRPALALPPDFPEARFALEALSDSLSNMSSPDLPPPEPPSPARRPASPRAAAPALPLPALAERIGALEAEFASRSGCSGATPREGAAPSGAAARREEILSALRAHHEGLCSGKSSFPQYLALERLFLKGDARGAEILFSRDHEFSCEGLPSPAWLREAWRTLEALYAGRPEAREAALCARDALRL